MGYNDEWFEDKIEKEYGWRIRTETPHQHLLRKTEERIMSIIIAHRNDGISHLQLANIAQVNRKNLSPHIKRLMNKGLVIREKGKQGKYYPTTKEYRGTILTADIFGKAAAGIILANEDFPLDSPFFRSKIITSDELQSSLFTFSNKVGSIITYLLIQSMNPSNKIMGETKDDEEKDLKVERWIDDAISSLVPVLLPFLKEYTASLLTGINCWKDDGSIDQKRSGLRFLNYLSHPPHYILNEEFISEFMAAFSKAYPNITNALENIRSQLPKAVERQVSRWEYEAYSSQQQKHCKHKYGLPKNITLLAKYNNNIKHCPNCHKTGYKINPFLK